MLTLKLRQAETALKDGRLDEAFQIARAADVREHRRGQELIGLLARALVARGKEHLAADQPEQALAACAQAMELAGSLPEAVELKAAVTAHVSNRQETERRKANAIGAARHHLRDGELSMGEQWMKLAGSAAEPLAAEAALRRTEVDARLAQAEEALAREDWSGVVEALLRVRQTHSTNTRLAGLTADLTARVVRKTRTAIETGRLDQAGCLLQLVCSLSAQAVEVRELTTLLEECRRASAGIESGEPRRALEVLRRLKSILPGAAWVADTLAACERMAEGLEALRGGPLGMLAVAAKPVARVNHEDTLPMAAPVTPPATTAEPVSSKLIMHVDGVGSFLIMRGRSVSIGPASSSQHPDVPVLCEGGLAPVMIERLDEDYFVNAPAQIAVNNQRTARKLLTDGDQIALGARGRIRFSLPNAASTTAVLSLAGTRMPGSDATRVIMLSDSLVIGPGSSAHIRVDDMPERAIIHVRDGRLFCHSGQDVTVDERPADRQAGLPLNATVRVGGVSMVFRTA